MLLLLPLGHPLNTAALPSTDHSAGTAPVTVAVGDFNLDGKPDLTVSNPGSSRVSILLGNGDGTFQAARMWDVGVNPQSLAVVDFNGDGKLDLVVVHSAGFNVLQGNGDGTFQAVRSFGGRFHAPTLASASPGSWAPPDIDQKVPPVDRNATCSLPQVLHATSARVEELVVNLQQFSATEHIEHFELDKNGKARSPAMVTFTYVAEIHEIPPRMLAVEEYRNGSLGLESFPGRLATTGTAAFALIFHPDFINDFAFECEGLTYMQGQPAWQLHFAQRPERLNRFHVYRIADARYPVRLKGRAWIAVNTAQVLRLETDLVEPIREILLHREHVAIEYRPVEFPKRNLQLWLPEAADIYMDFRGHRYHRRHSFSDFQLFWVDVAEQTHEPQPH